MSANEFQSLDIQDLAKKLKVSLKKLDADKTSNPVELVKWAKKCSEEKAVEWLQKTYKTTPKKAAVIELFEEDVQKIKLAQDYVDGIGYYTVSAYAKKDGRPVEQPFVVTSERDFFPCTLDELLHRHIYFDKFPHPRVRWSRRSLKGYLEEAEQVWPIKECYEAVLRQVNHYLDLGNPDMASCMALWILGTYCYRLFGSFPYIHLNGNMECGKTKTLQLIALLSFNGELFSSNSSPAAILRRVDTDCATCCIDEVENLNRQSGGNDDLRSVQAVLNSGYKLGGGDMKCEERMIGKIKQWVPVYYDGFCPKVLAGIKTVNPTLSSRCISIIMVRSSNGEIRNREIHMQNAEWKELRDIIYPCILSSFPAISERAKATLSVELSGREWELWKPIITLAGLIDSKLDARMRALAKKQREERSEVDTETPIFLQAIWQILDDDIVEEQYYPNSELLERLPKIDEDTYGWLEDDKKKKGGGKWLGNALRRCGVVKGASELKSIDGKKHRGYTLNKNLIESLLAAYGVPPVTGEDKAVTEKEDAGNSAVTEKKKDCYPKKELGDDLPDL